MCLRCTDSARIPVKILYRFPFLHIYTEFTHSSEIPLTFQLPLTLGLTSTRPDTFPLSSPHHLSRPSLVAWQQRIVRD